MPLFGGYLAMANITEEIPVGDEQLPPPPVATVKLQPGFEKVYVLRHNVKFYDDIVAVTTDKELADKFYQAGQPMGFTKTEVRLINSVEDLAEIEKRLKRFADKG
jgi:hypothetical protein